LLPDQSTLPGWRIAEGPVSYDSVTLYEYLDGGAPLYLDFGFEGLDHVRYQLGDDNLSSVTLDVYDMGTELGAFGLFRSGRPLDAEVREWGAEGYRSDNIAAAWKGTISIRAEADDARPELISAMEQLVAAVANEVDGGTSPPPIIGALPPQGLVRWSERLVAKDLMSHVFLPGGVVATYRVAENEGTVYFTDLEDEAAVSEAMEMLRAHHQKYGEVLGDVTSISYVGFRFSDPGLGNGTLLSSGTYVVGAHGDLSTGVQLELLDQLVQNLQSRTEG
jgi:hypothetical protein